MAEIKSLLDDVIVKEINEMDALPSGDDKDKAIRGIVQLHKLRMDEIKAQTEADERRERRDMDNEKSKAELALKEREAAEREVDHTHAEDIARQQIRENKIDRCVKTGVAVAELVLPLAFYGIWMKKGFKFEENGTFTSTTFKNLLNRFRPTK